MSRYRKYHNTPTIIDGITFQSKKEAKRWWELKQLEKAGKIINLERQKKYVFDKLTLPLPKKQKVARHPSYVADFVYTNFEIKAGGVCDTVVEDTKGMVTDLFKYKWALMKYFYNIEVKVI